MIGIRHPRGTSHPCPQELGSLNAPVYGYATIVDEALFYTFGQAIV